MNFVINTCDIVARDEITISGPTTEERKARDIQQ